MRQVLSSLALVSAFASCSTPTEPKYEGTFTMHVAASLVVCHQWYGLSECLYARKEGSEQWWPLFWGITGFEHERGFEYVLRIAEYSVRHPPADGPSREYHLVRVMSRVRVPEPSGAATQEK